MEELDQEPVKKPRFSPGMQIWLLILMFLFAQMISSFFFILFRPLFGEVDFEKLDFNEATNGYLSAAVSSLSIFLVGFLFFLRMTRQKYKDIIKFEKWNLKSLGVVLLLLIGGIIISEGLQQLNQFIIGHFPQGGFLDKQAEYEEYYRNWFHPDKRNLLPIAIFVFALFPAIAEELVFRGLLLTKLKEVSHGNTNFAVIVSSLLFAAVHMQPWNLLPMIAMGIIFGYVYVYTKDIRYSILMHFLFNALQLIVAFYFVDQVVA